MHEFLRVTDRPEETFVAGLSMGGYGALKLALTHPERYAAAASLSGALDLRTLLLHARRPALLDRVFGGTVTDEDDLFTLPAAGVRRTSAVSGVRHRGPAAARAPSASPTRRPLPGST